MIPIIYDNPILSGNGYGRMADAISCTVTHEINGQYELAMEYPVTGQHYDRIDPGMVLFAAPDPVTAEQPFRIYRVTRPLNGVVTVYARHIAYDMSGIAVLPFTASSLTEAFEILPNQCVPSCPFTFFTTRTVASNMKLGSPMPLWQLLGGVAGSFLDVYGGEWVFDGFRASLPTRMGMDKGVTVRYGKNLTELEQDITVEATWGAVMPYWYDDESGDLVQLPAPIPVPGAFGDRILVLNLTDSFEEKPTQAQLQIRAERYIRANDIGTPQVSWKVNMAMLEQSGEYETHAILERVELGDTVTIIYEPMGFNAKARAVLIEYDVLLDRYKSLTLGRVKQNLAQIVAGTSGEIENAVKSVKSSLERAIDVSTDFITHGTGYMRFIYNDDNELQEIVSLDNPDINLARSVWRWNNGGFGHSSTGYAGPYTVAMTQDGAIVADFITAGTMSADRIRAGTISISKMDQAAQDEIAKGQDALEAADDAQATADGAATAALNAQTAAGNAQTTADNAATAASNAATAASNAQTTANNAAAAASAAQTTANAALGSTDSKQQYYLSTSSTSTTGGAWQDTVPEWVSGTYVWTRIATDATTKDGTTLPPVYSTPVYDVNLTNALSTAAAASSAASAAQTTANGAVTAAGNAQSTANSAVTAAGNAQTAADNAATAAGNAQTTADNAVRTTTVTPEYYLSDSDSVPTGGSWGTTIPTWTEGKYIWTRVATTTTPAVGSSTTTYMPAPGGEYDSNLTEALMTSVDAQRTASQAIANTPILNMLPAAYYREVVTSNPYVSNGITWTVNPDGSITATGTATSASYYAISGSQTTESVPVIRIDPSKKYTFAGTPAGGSTSTYHAQLRITPAGQTPSTTSGTRYNDTGNGVTAPEGGTYAFVRLAIGSGYDCGAGITFYPMLEAGDVKHGYISTHNGTGAMMEKTIASAVPVYYRSTSTDTPAKPTSTVTSTAANADNIWTLSMPRPKKWSTYFTATQYVNAAGTVSWSNVTQMANTTYVANWASTNDSTYIDGANIYTGTVTTGALAAGAVTADKIDVVDLFSQNLTASNFTITGGTININTTNDQYSALTLNFSGTQGSLQTKVLPGSVQVSSGTTSIHLDADGIRFSENNQTTGWLPATGIKFMDVNTTATSSSSIDLRVKEDAYNAVALELTARQSELTVGSLFVIRCTVVVTLTQGGTQTVYGTLLFSRSTDIRTAGGYFLEGEISTIYKLYWSPGGQRFYVYVGDITET